MPVDHKTHLIRNGVDPEEAELIQDAINLGRSRASFLAIETTALRSVRRTFFATGTGRDYREFHRLVNEELKELTPGELAFGDIPDMFREQHAAFCFNMHEGHQSRYLDRHEDETTEEFLDRPGKTTMNITRRVIDALSKLYHKPPTREFTDDESEDDAVETPGSARHQEQQDRLNAVWGNKLFNPTMIDVDRFTRLLGTVAIRPIYDPAIKGKVRLWLFMSHQLRVIPHPTKPWRPAAVIERIHPFGKDPGLVINVWTDEHYVMLKGSKVTVERHGLGRIPHVFSKDGMSWNSFFVEGRGRSLCEPNAVMNNDLTDLEEIKQMQGFSVMEVINADDADDIRVGPRQMFKFTVKDKDLPFGVNFKSPSAPLGELRADIESQVRHILMTNNVPPAAIGAAIDERSLSGEAIRAAMQPVVDDLEERAEMFEPVEWDLSDSMLRIIAKHEPAFIYAPKEDRPEFEVEYQKLSLPKSTQAKVTQDDFDIAQGRETPASTMRRDNPDKFPTHEKAVEQWHANLDETRAVGFDIKASEDDPDDPDTTFGNVGTGPKPKTPLLDALEGDGALEVDGA